MSSYASTSDKWPAIVLVGVGCILAGIGAVLYPGAMFAAMAAGGALLAFRWLIPNRLQFWQALVAASLAGFIVLNYGFENLVAGHVAGVPLLIGETAMLIGLTLAIRRQGMSQLKPALRDPIVRCLIALLVVSALHLIVEAPRFGVYAFRDASLYFEAVFLTAGYLWANEKNGVKTFVQFMLVVFVLNLIYSFTLPWRDTLQSLSPTSGVFQPIPIIGQYQDGSVYLAAGAFFFAWLADYTRGWRCRVLLVVATVQVLALAVLQDRGIYVGIVVVLVLLFVLKKTSKMRRPLRVLGGSALAMFALLTVMPVFGVSIHGRVGEINGEFLRQYALSVLSLDNSNTRLAKDDDRLDWFRQVWRGTTSEPVTFLIGQGFGMPLIDFLAEDGMPVRQPHNAALGVFGRLGVAGLSLWLLFQLLLFKRFLAAVKAHKSREIDDLNLWLFIFFVLAFVISMTQPSLEFSHYAVPLFFMTGFALRTMRTRSDLEIRNVATGGQIVEDPIGS
jgi:hypothetical protein